MFSPFECTKIVFLNEITNYIVVFGIKLNYYITNNTISLLFFYIFFIFLFFTIIIWRFNSTSLDLIYIIYDFVFDLIESYLGEGEDDVHISEMVFPFLLYLFIFLWINNIIGLLPFQFAITSHLSSTFACSLFVWFWVVTLGFYLNGFSFFNLILPVGIPSLLIPFLIVIEFISYIFRSLSLAIRLFANIFAGHILLHVVSSAIASLIISVSNGFLWYSFFFGIISITLLVILFCFEFMVACLQSYIFLVLSLIYLRDLSNLSH